MDIFRNASGMDQCRRCNFIGIMREGGIDEINSARKRIQLAKGQLFESSQPNQGASAKITNKELNERLEKLKEKKSGEFDII